MASIDFDKFTKRQKKVSLTSRALGHPARVAILQYLARKGACFCGELVDVVPLAQATVSQHLKELKQAGLIRGDVEGPRVCYFIDPSGIKEAADLLTGLVGDLRRCC